MGEPDSPAKAASPIATPVIDTIVSKGTGKSVLVEENTKKVTGVAVRRSSRRKCNVLLSTRHLSTFHQLFFNTDRRNDDSSSEESGSEDDGTGNSDENSGDDNSAEGSRRRKRIKPSEETEELEELVQEEETKQVGRLLLKKVHDSPHIYLIDNYLTEADLLRCTQIIKTSAFEKSFVDNPESKEVLVDTEHRTSTFVSVPKQADSKISAMERKSAELLGISVGQMEPLQIVRYRQDQFFGIHHDLGIFNDDDCSVELPPKHTLYKRRLATIFCYLNDVAEGGCTYFPLCNDLRVQPKRGRAVLFCNILQDGDADPKTVHAGEPVRGKGSIKYGLNIWACEE